MKALLITAKNKNEHKLISDLLRKLGVSSRLISKEELEDLALSRLMNEADRSKKVSKSSILKKLKV